MAKYRFNFTKEFQDCVVDFSKKHKLDNIKDFKNYFEIWCNENKGIIDDEFVYLTRLGFEGDIIDKIYKSSRYYFKNKSDVKKEPKKRKKYTSKNNQILKLVYDHINNMKIRAKPSVAFSDFEEKHSAEIERFKAELIENGYEEKGAIKKIKKIYKNKYFMLKNN
mgnify:FL=1